MHRQRKQLKDKKKSHNGFILPHHGNYLGRMELSLTSKEGKVKSEDLGGEDYKYGSVENKGNLLSI